MFNTLIQLELVLYLHKFGVKRLERASSMVSFILIKLFD